ncbi:sensor histidine kinase [Allocoleopsis franciscana]|uniref:histidine kinase n=1 Tax=Allocoleopsis franciscana PCC 7113 TaxID=1173027 RepID=K9WQ77_9CYAN|nr:HAMP domain-containing sensor histidine kinase [Allocoleopsis franciscana]AFZ21697.1 histidine kinase [Allocoleopsis franciscana PCC 7113]
MLRRLIAILKMQVPQGQNINTVLLIVGLFAIILVLDFFTPPPYALGFLYTGPILLASSRLSRSATLQVTVMATGLTLLNLFIPKAEWVNLSSVMNRTLMALALVVTGWLSERNLSHEEAIARHKAQLQAQEYLASVREDFVSTLTHDLKTPLLGAIETLQSLQQEKYGAVTSAQEKVFAAIVRSHERSLALIETLLDVYRNDTEGVRLKKKPVKLVDLAEEAIATLSDLASKRQVDVDLSYAKSGYHSLWVNGDALQLQRVFTNLLTNAINSCPRGGKVEIVLESDSSYQMVKIVDNGRGITPDELPRLFERFYQGHSDRQSMGSGLGLYLTRQIIEAHGGTVWGKNRSPSTDNNHRVRGASFGFRLPVQQRSEQLSSQS